MTPCPFVENSWKVQYFIYLCYYRPQRSCGQDYVFTRVCDSVNGGGGWVSASMLGYHPPPEQTSPLEQTPSAADTPSRSTHPPGADSGIRLIRLMHPTGMHSCLYYLFMKLNNCFGVINVKRLKLLKSSICVRHKAQKWLHCF